MIHAEKHIVLQDETLLLNSLRSLYWPKEKTLIASDLHIGKSAHFRKHGIPVSSRVQHSDLDRLSFLISHYQAERLIVVGDLFHAEVNSDFNVFHNWRMTHQALDIWLIKGNHDRLKHEVYDRFRLSCCKESTFIMPFDFIHEPPEHNQNFSISGHVHPGISVKLKSSPRIKLPCFQVSKQQLILPAFSKFTGLNDSKPPDSSIFYAFTDTAFFTF